MSSTIPIFPPPTPKKKSPTVRLVILGALAIVLLIPQFLVMALVNERQSLYHEAQRSISKPWGQAQTIAPPYLAVPISVNKKHEGGYVHILADSATIQVNMHTEERYRSIYKATLYRTQVTIRGEFVDLQERIGQETGVTFDWDNVAIISSVSDLVGLKSLVRIQIADQTLELSPGGSSQSSDFTCVDNPLVARCALPSTGKIPFSYTYELNGSEEINFYPLAGNTVVKLDSDFPNPSFDGAYLPDTRTISKDGTTAQWQVLYVNRPTPQEFVQWTYGEDRNHYSDSDNIRDYEYVFGMELMEINNPYDMVERAIKYAILFIVFTFLTFFFTDTFAQQEIPIVGYLLVGLALLVFYTLLLSIAEYLSFGASFLISSVAVGLMVSSYLYGFVHQWKPVLFCGGILALLYLFLYIILQLESFPLLVGSIFLFVILGVVMYLSQKMKW